MSKTKSGKLQLLLIAAVFFGPLVFAAWLYYQGDDMQPEGRTNHGALLEPITNLRDTLPESPLNPLNEDHWVLLYTDLDACDEPCREGLYTIRQSRLMLGREMDRIQRVFLHGDSAPDTLFLAEQHEGLATIQDAALAEVLGSKRPASLPAGGYFLIDPLGNLVLYFEPGVDPADMVGDIKRLLRLSRIG